MKINLTVLFFLVVSCLFAQEKTKEISSVRKDFSLPDPLRYEVFYDIASGQYFLYPKVGGITTGFPIVMHPKEYQSYVMSNYLSDYYREKSSNNDLRHRKDKTEAGKKGLLPSIKIKNKLFEAVFGGNKIELIPQGFASFDLGGLYQKIGNPMILPQNRTSFAFDLQQRIQLGITGKVGENLQLRANYDTQSGFAFENKMNLVWQSLGTWRDLQNKKIDEYLGEKEDRIIKRVEFGNVNMPLSTSLIRGSESLFGAKTEFQFGKTKGTLVLSQQQGEARNIVVQGGGAMQTFKINAVDYEENQHYYLGHYFLNHYDEALQNYPLINSKININRIEVWVLDQGTGNLQEQKSIVAVRDLGEGNSGYPSNNQNRLYQNITNLGQRIRDANTAYNTIKGQSFSNVNGTAEVYTDGEQFIFNRRARRLNSNEFTYNPQLGYLSLNQRLNDNQLLAVSYSYTVNGDRKVYKVGEFSEESPVLITKLLKPNISVKTTSPMWDLMMKNIYPMDAAQVSSENFVLNLYYRDPQNGKVNYLPNTNVQDTNLLKLFNWDRLNANNDLQNDSSGFGDGLFDFVKGITIDPENGKLIFTKAKPFGSYLEQILGTNDAKFVFSDLYTQQKQIAAQNNLALRYTIEGRYKGSQGSGISLGAINVPKGSVKVTSNGQQLVEGQDYTVDYLLGSVTIINEVIKNSGQAINVSLENQLTFNTQRKRFLGLNLERTFNENFTVGATAVNYSERPLTQKVNFGSEAVNNTMLGVNMLYNNELPFLTRLTDKIPFINTEAPSNFNFRIETAYLLPGQSNDIGNHVYVDDFDQSSSKISIKDPASWGLASKPEQNTNDPVYANATLNDNIGQGYGRGLISWYNIDPRFYNVGGKAPNGINAAAVSNHASRRVQLSEILNNRDFVAGEQTYTDTFDISYYPKERGPYNLNPNTETPDKRWAGLMRPISVSNFTHSNIEYIEFWLMDPYADGRYFGAAPKLRLHLGNISEDILKDGKLSYENGLPTPSSNTSISASNWGNQPNQSPVLYAYSTEGEERTVQDIGLDGLDNRGEMDKFGTSFVNPVTNVQDPAADDFVYYLSNRFSGQQASSVIERYKYFRNPDGNSASGSLEVATQFPDAEDINRDYNLDQSESYNQYTINLDKASLQLNQNFIVDVKEVESRFQNGQTGKSKWYLFRVPVSRFDTGAGEASLSVLDNVRFARLVLDGFEDTATLRFGSMDLVRSDWRKYSKNIAYDNAVVNPNIPDNEGTFIVNNDDFFVGSVNLEENALGTPPYVLPPGIERQILSGNTGAQRQNEASLYMKFLNLGHDAKGVVKSTLLDMRRYKYLEMFVHAENLMNSGLNHQLDENAKFFIRFGSDATDNYYEYEASLKYTSINAKSPQEIWPQENMVNIAIQNFVDAKIQRDKTAANMMGYRYRYADFGDEHKKIFVKGRPSLGNITTMMIGVRNTSNTSKDLILWVNEIRMSGIENQGGYAGNAGLDFNLGDFATVNANATYTSVGFGSIDSKPMERMQSSQSAFGVNATVNVDKFLPEKAGIKIPVNYSYTQSVEDPKYSLIDSDVEFSKAHNREQLEKVSRTYTQQRSIGVLNMRKERMNPAKKQRFYDVENISLTAVYNDDYYRDVYTARNYRQSLRGYADYNYNFKPWVIKPFDKVISDTAKSVKYLMWIKELNFNPVPTRVSFRTELDRNYSEYQFRNVEALLSSHPNRDFEVIKNRNFFFGWQYMLGFNFTKSLKLDINSATRTLNDHVDGSRMNTKSIFETPFRSGRPILYNHHVQVSYKLPFQHFPYLDFISAEMGYGLQYNWNARSTVLLNNLQGNLGHMAQNTNNILGTASVDFPSFFQKFDFFRKIEKNLTARGKEIDSLNEVYEKSALAMSKKNRFFVFNKYKEYRFKNKLPALHRMAYALTSIKQMNINYNENNGTVLPGILSSPNFYGYGQGIGGPTLGFLIGSQADIRRHAIENGWISKSELMTEAYSQTNSKTVDINLQLMPINDLRIDFTGMLRTTRNLIQGGYNIDVDASTRYFDFAYENELFTVSRTAWTFKTAFDAKGNLYDKVVANAKSLSQKTGSAIESNGFTRGYSLANPYMLVPAFQAAVEGKAIERMGNPKEIGIPLPNWNIVYLGLKHLPIINSQFSKFDIMHSYTSTYTNSGIQSNIDYYNNPSAFDVNGDKINPYVFNQLGYVEAFAPLIAADVTMRNNMQFRLQYNRDRMLMLGLVNHTLTEDMGKEYIFGFGYIVKDLKMKVNVAGKSRTMNSDLNVRLDFSLRDNKTRITNILLDDSQITGGQRLLSMKFSADYNISQNFNLRLFYDQMMTRYKISTAYPLSTVRAGLTATFTFGGSQSH